jgi:ribonuclease HI
MVIDTDELTQREEGLKRLLRGYRALFFSPDTNPDEKQELQEGITKNEAELAAVQKVLAALSALASLGYPDHTKETASQTIIDALKRLADDVALAPKDFAEPTLLADGGNVEVI